MANKNFDVSKLLKSYQDIEKLAESTVTKAARLNQLKEYEQTLLEKNKTEREVQTELLKKQGELLDTQEKNLRNQQSLMVKILEENQEIVKWGGKLSDLQEVGNERAQKNLIIIKDRLEVLKKQTIEFNKQVASFERFSKLREDADKVMSSLFKFKGNDWKDTALGSLFNSLSNDGLMSSFRSIGSSIMTAISPINLLGNALNDTVDMFKSFENARADLVKDTGIAAYSDTLATVGQKNITLGINSEGAAKAIKSLHTEFTDFTTLAVPAQLELAKFDASMEKLGVSTDITAKNIQLANKVMGMNASQAMKSQKELLSLATQLRVSPQKMAADFQASMPKLAAWGNSVIDKFKELSVVAKRTGLDIQELTQWATQFDTFEGAAESAGKLNAILGGPLLDSMQMVYMTETERIVAIRKAVESTGQSFGSMSRYQRKAIASAAGFSDVSQLAKALSGDIEGLEAASKAEAASQEKMNEMIRDARPLMEKLMDISKSLTSLLMPVISGLASVVKFLSDGFAALTKATSQDFASGLMFVGSVGLFFVSKFGLVGAALSKVGSLFKFTATKAKELAETAKDVIKPTEDLGNSVSNAGKSASSSALGMLAFGAAVLLVSSGIYLVFQGVTSLSAAMSELTTGQMVGLGIMTGVVIGGIIGLMFALYAITPAAAAAEWPLVAVGAAITLIGGGISLILVGLAKVIDSFTGLSESASMFASISSISSETAGNIKSVSSAISEMSKAMDDLPTDKTVQLRYLLDATNRLTSEKANNIQKLAEQVNKFNTTSTNTTTNTIATSNNVSTVGSSGNRTIILQLDGRTLKKFVVDVMNEEMNPRKI